MNVLIMLYTIVLFVLLTPGILITFPSNGGVKLAETLSSTENIIARYNQLQSALFHGLIFMIICSFTYSAVLKLGSCPEPVIPPSDNEEYDNESSKEAFNNTDSFRSNCWNLFNNCMFKCTDPFEMNI